MERKDGVGSEVPDAELVARMKRGDKAAFRELARRHVDSLFRVAYSLVGSKEDAEDVVQETMLAAISRIKSFEGRSAVGTWLHSILMFQASKLRRSRRVRMAVPLERADEVSIGRDAGLQTPCAGAAVDRQVDVLAMLDTLSAEHRDVLVLRELQQLSYDQIAGILKIPPGTVMSRLHRARQELKERFSGYNT